MTYSIPPGKMPLDLWWQCGHMNELKHVQTQTGTNKRFQKCEK